MSFLRKTRSKFLLGLSHPGHWERQRANIAQHSRSSAGTHQTRTSREMEMIGHHWVIFKRLFWLLIKKKGGIHLFCKYRLLEPSDNDIIAVPVQKWRVWEGYKNYGFPPSRGLMWHIMATEGATNSVQSIKQWCSDGNTSLYIQIFPRLEN